MLVMLSQYQKVELLASLLLLHFLYLVLPLAVALLVLGVRETGLARSAKSPLTICGAAEHVLAIPADCDKAASQYVLAQSVHHGKPVLSSEL
jgi:hypothetical protein